MASRKNVQQRLLAYSFITPALLITLGVVAYPILNVIVRSFQTEDGYGLDHYIYLFTNPIALENLFYTLYICIVTVVLAIAVAYGLALFMRFSNSRVSKTIGALYLLPRFIPGLVAVNAMITVIRDSGLLNRIALTFGYDFKPGLMFNDKGIILMNLWFNIPFATMLILAGLSNIPDSVIDSARDVGASRRVLFTKMIVPLTMKDVMIAATFIFMSNVGSFTTPYLMGSTSPQMIGVSLFTQFNNLNYGYAAALSVVMFLLCSVSAAVYIITNMRDKAWEKQE
jgi:ABC-type spermidine/putrescine transport system, permease component I